MNTQKEIDLSKLFGVLSSNKRSIRVATGVTTLIAIIYCIFATPIFTAQVLINPPKLADAGAGITQVMNGLSVLGGGGGGLLNQKTDADISIAILKTDAIKDMIIKKFNLQTYLEKDNIELTRRALDSKIKFVQDVKSGFVEIDVDDKDPKLSADIANYYTIALGQMISNISYSRSNVKFSFFTLQLADAESSLDLAQENLKKFAESNGFVAGQQVQALARIGTQLQAQLVVAQAQLQSMSLYATPDNPEYINLKTKIDSYKQQLDNITSPESPDSIGVPANTAPKLAKQYAKLMQELALRQEIYKVIQKQYEANRLDMLSEISPVGIQIVDPAQVPFYKSKPKRLFVILGGFMFGLIVSSVYFVIRNRKKIIVEVDNEKSAN